MSRSPDPSTSVVGVVILDSELRLERFTPGAAHLLNVTTQDIGTALSDTLLRRLGLTLTDEDRVVLGRHLPIRRDVRAPDGRPWLVWIRWHPADDRGASGLVVTVFDVGAMRRADSPSRVDPRLSARAVPRLSRPDGTLEDRLAEREKWLSLVHDITRAVNDAVSWDGALHLVLELICRAERWQIGHVYLPDPNAPDQFVMAIGCVEGERFEPFHEASRQLRYSRGQSLPGLVFASGEVVWVNGHEELLKALPRRANAAKAAGLRAGAALPVTKGLETIAVLEIFSDQPHALSAGLSEVMTDVGAQISHVIERERLVSQAAAMAWREQQDLIHTLHDAVGQELTSAGLLGANLVQRLREHDPTAAGMAQHVADAAQRALEQVRQLSKGVFPVPTGGDGLMVALEQLASMTRTRDQISCKLASKAPVVLQDNRIATELYRIAQGAVTNAVKHARASEIIIHLNAESGASVLTITDDGIGIEDVRSHGAGVGLRIMQYRARAIGANLSVGPRPGGGTVITCVWRQPPNQ